MIYINMTNQTIAAKTTIDPKVVYNSSREMASMLESLDNFNTPPSFSSIENCAEQYVSIVREFMADKINPANGTLLLDDGNAQIGVVIAPISFVLPEVAALLADRLSIDVYVVHEFSCGERLVKVADGGI